jgi:hypothetical protein
MYRSVQSVQQGRRAQFFKQFVGTKINVLSILLMISAS